MPTFRTTVDADGKIHLPREFRERLGLETGHEVEFFESLDGDIIFHALAGTARGWKDSFSYEKRIPPISIREMDESIADAIADDVERTLGPPKSAAKPPAAAE